MLWSAMHAHEVAHYAPLFASTPLELALLDTIDGFEWETARAEQERDIQETFNKETEDERDALKEKLEAALDLLQCFVDYCNDPVGESDPTEPARQLLKDNPPK